MALRIVSDIPGLPYLYLGVVNGGSLTTSDYPFPYDPETADDAAVFSPNRTIARRWRYILGTGYVNQAVPVEYATHEYIPMVSPDGTLYVYGIDNSGTWPNILPLFTDDAGRTVRTTLMHKGKVAWVADNRFPPPR